MGGLCRDHPCFVLLLCKKRNKSATLRLLDVLVTQHAKWTARRIRRALFGQSLVDFSTPSWSCIKIRETDHELQPVNRRKKAVSRMSQEFSQVEALQKSCVPGMTFYDDSLSIDVDMDEADQDSAAISQRCDFFELSPS